MATLQLYKNLGELVEILDKTGTHKNKIEKYKAMRQSIKRGLEQNAVNNGKVMHGWGDNKTPVDEQYIAAVEKYAPDLMFMALAWHKDDVTEKLLKRNINYIGIEALFDQESDEICSREYINKMHDKGLLVWVNSIVYNESDVISAGHTDDSAFTVSPEHGWGWIADIGADFMQTDWLSDAQAYFARRK